MAAGFCPKNLAFSRKWWFCPIRGAAAPLTFSAYSYVFDWLYPYKLWATEPVIYVDVTCKV